jgi:hypothetical protein
MSPPLYKYRNLSERERTLAALRDGKSWFAGRHQVNDLYDCEVRLPKAITKGDVRRILRLVAGRSYSPTGLPPEGLLAAIESSRDPFERLGLIAEYAHDGDLLNVLADASAVPHAVDILWFASYGAVGRFFAATTVLCLSESPLNQVMWGMYADSYRGFCIGYRLRPEHPLAARLHPVTYTTQAGPINFGSAVQNPNATRDALVYRKPIAWSHEREWRVTVAGEPALREPPLQIAEIIFGAAMQPQERQLIASAVEGRNVKFRELRLAYKSGYDLSLADCSEDRLVRA